MTGENEYFLREIIKKEGGIAHRVVHNIFINKGVQVCTFKYLNTNFSSAPKNCLNSNDPAAFNKFLRKYSIRGRDSRGFAL